MRPLSRSSVHGHYSDSRKVGISPVRGERLPDERTKNPDHRSITFEQDDSETSDYEAGRSPHVARFGRYPSAARGFTRTIRASSSSLNPLARKRSIQRPKPSGGGGFAT